MTAWVRSAIDIAVILPTLSLLLMVSTITLVEYTISGIPRPPGIWAFRPPLHPPPAAIVPPPWETKLEEGDIESDPDLAVPIWNQNRSGDMFAALLLSLIVPWIVSQILNPYPAKLMSVFRARMGAISFTG